MLDRWRLKLKPPRKGAPWEVDLAVLVGCSAAVVVAALLTLEPSGKVALPIGGGLAMPRTCMAKQMTGIDCPGCGLTRSFVAMGSGQFAAAYRVHRLGPLLFMLVFLQIPLRAYAILRGVRCPWEIEAWGKGIVIWGSVILLWVNWVYDLLTGAALEP